jgi:branched-chain amino acid transport system permease protein
MGLGGAIQAHLIGFIAPDNYLPTLTFQIWAMLIIGGSGNNRGALLGAVAVWGLWSLTGAALSAFVPAEHQARVAALQIVLIGVVLALVLVMRPRGLLGESILVSRFLRK